MTDDKMERKIILLIFGRIYFMRLILKQKTVHQVDSLLVELLAQIIAQFSADGWVA